MLLEGESSKILVGLASPRFNLVLSNILPNGQATKSGVKKERQTKIGLGEGRGPTMCHNILLPSKNSTAWRNIPLCGYYLC